MRKYLFDYAYLLLFAGSIIFVDQLTKYIIRANLELGEVFLPDLWLTQFARIVHWQNTGAAFGMFQSLGNVFMVLSMIVSLAILYYFPQVPRQDKLIRLSMSMLLGGAVGNLIDRLHQGYVTDFISVGKLPVFNVADASISLGVVVLFLGMWFQEKKASQDSAETDEGAEDDNKVEISLSPAVPPEEARSD